MNFHAETIENVFSDLDSSIEGLSQNSADNRLLKYGKNQFEHKKPKSLIRRFVEQILDPMIIILIFAAIVSAVLAIAQNDSFADVVIIISVVVINAVLGVYQESKAEKSLEALKQMSASKSKVKRDGKIIEEYSANLVPGDVVILQAGDSVPADGRLIKEYSLKVDESALTGESLPVNKLIDVLGCKKPGVDIALADRTNMVYMGTNVVYGRAEYVVCSTGMNTEMGNIASALNDVSEKKTQLQIKMSQLSKFLTWLVLGICVVVFAVQLIRANSFDFQFALDSFMIAVTLAVAAIPEGLPAIVTVALSIGVSKMSKRNAIVRKLTAVETLGCAQIICSDKTGTLTQNKMTVTEFKSSDPDLLAAGMLLCCDVEINDNDLKGEPTELALVRWAIKDDKYTLQIRDNYQRISEIPFESQRKMMSTLHDCKSQNNKFLDINCDYIQFTKGAPDYIVDRCKYIYLNGKVCDLTDEQKTQIKNKNKEMADKALRVLSLAIKLYKDADDYSDLISEQEMIYVGMTGMIDIVRPEAKDAIIQCEQAGIRPIMITGDNIDTAKAIALELGILRDGDKALSGQDINNLNDKEFDACLSDVSVYARVEPQHKTRIVKAWQKAGYVVAMTGDGVNDAPSIKNADIGVGMGITGTDVSKGAADIILTDDNFATIVNAVEEGRRIYDNIIKCIQYLLSSNIGEVLSVFVASLLGFTVLRPVHLLWVNLVTDCVPALALGLEDKEPNIMERKPREKNAGIFSDGVMGDIVYQGIIITVLIFVSYFCGHYIEFGTWAIETSEHGITMAFLTMSMVGCFHAINMRSRRQSIFKLKSKNVVLFLSVIISLILTTIACEVDPVANAFKLAELGIFEWALSLGLGLAIIPIVELVKFFQRRFSK